MEKGDRVIVHGRVYTCKGIHPDGDSMLGVDAIGKEIKLDECEFHRAFGAWCWTRQDEDVTNLAARRESIPAERKGK